MFGKYFRSDCFIDEVAKWIENSITIAMWWQYRVLGECTWTYQAVVPSRSSLKQYQSNLH